MSIKDISQKIKSSGIEYYESLKERYTNSSELKTDLFLILCFILITLASFGLGRLSALEKGRENVQIKTPDFLLPGENLEKPVNISGANIPLSASAMISTEKAKGFLVASKSGKKYHFPWCAGASQIADKNKIWFDSYEEAKKAGYTPAANCKDLK